MIELASLLECLKVRAEGDGRYAAPNLVMPYHRIFGGQLLAQAIAIATHSAEGKSVKSLHVTFPREGDLSLPVDYALTSLQDGRSFAVRTLVGSQGGRTVFAALISLHAEESGLEHGESRPGVGAPEDAAPRDLGMIPWETRVVGDVDLDSHDVGPAALEVWMRAPTLPDDPVTHQALLAHATDLTLIATALRPHAGVGESDAGTRLATAVTTHTVWFHRPFRLDDWLLLAQTSPVAAGARAFGRGDVFTHRGELVASFAQESLIRGGG